MKQKNGMMPPVTAEEFWRKGYRQLVSVIPPGADLTPASRVGKAQRGKAPGRRKPSGMWSGYNWRKHQPTLADMRQWDQDGANIGIKADLFPAVDIDTVDESMAQLIRNVALNTLGRAPARIGAYPKQLLVYRTEEPFGRMRLWIDNRKHLVEILGQGQQYLIAGTHNATLMPYRWESAIHGIPMAVPKASQLTEISCIKAQGFLLALENILTKQGISVQREGDGAKAERVIVVQDELIAPSIKELTEAVEKIPNDNDTFPERRDYLRMGYAIKAAAGAHERKGEVIFQEWAAKWEGNGVFAGNDPLVVHDDYARIRGPFVVGWPWIQEQAGIGGEDDFDVI